MRLCKVDAASCNMALVRKLCPISIEQSKAWCQNKSLPLFILHKKGPSSMPLCGHLSLHGALPPSTQEVRSAAKGPQSAFLKKSWVGG